MQILLLLPLVDFLLSSLFLRFVALLGLFDERRFQLLLAGPGAGRARGASGHLGSRCGGCARWGRLALSALGPHVNGAARRRGGVRRRWRWLLRPLFPLRRRLWLRLP